MATNRKTGSKSESTVFPVAMRDSRNRRDITIKRVRKNGKFWVEARSPKGKILSRRRWSQKNFNLYDAVISFKRRGTFKSGEDHRRVRLSNVVEHQHLGKAGYDFKSSRTVRQPSHRKDKIKGVSTTARLQYVYEVHFQDGKRMSVAYGRSNMFYKGESVGQYKIQAKERAMKQVAGSLQIPGSDTEQIYPYIIAVREGYIWYRGRR